MKYILNVYLLGIIFLLCTYMVSASTLISPTLPNGTFYTNYIQARANITDSTYKNITYNLYTTGLVNTTSIQHSGVLTMDTGYQFACGLKTNGTIECWGGPGAGTVTPGVYGDGNIVAMSAGGYNMCGLKANRTVECWGDNSVGQSEPYTRTDALSMDCGNQETCVLKTNGTIECWGSIAAVFGEGMGITEISVGGGTVCGLQSNGTIYCWGNMGGAAPFNGIAKSLSVGGYHVAGLMNNGSVQSWGNYNPNPTIPYTLTDAVFVSAGWQGDCILKTNGTVECYQTGYAYTNTDAVILSENFYNRCVLKSNGTVECEGNTPNVIGNYTGTDIQKQQLYTFQNLANQTYYLNGTAHNLSGGIIYTETRKYMTYSSPTINFSADTEPNGTNITSRNNIYINLTISGYINYTIISLYNTTGIVQSQYATSYNFTGLVNGRYYFNATTCDMGSTCVTTETRNALINVTSNNLEVYAYQKGTMIAIPYSINLSNTSSSTIYTSNVTNYIITNITAGEYNVSVNSTAGYNVCNITNWVATSYYMLECALYDAVLNLSAIDTYLNTTINFTANISLVSGGYTEVFNATTTDYIMIPMITSRDYNITLTNPSYINGVYSVIGATTSSHTVGMDQTRIQLRFLHAFSSLLYNGTLLVNDTVIPGHYYNVTTGILNITPDYGTKNYSINILAQSRNQTYILLTTAREIGSRDILIYPILNMTIYDEKLSLINNTIYNFSSPNTMSYTLFCYSPANYTIATLIPNTTTGVFTMIAPCIFNRIRFTMGWNSIGGSAFSYYRTLNIPSTSTLLNLEVYLIDAFTSGTTLTYFKPYDIFGIYTTQQNTQILVYEVMPAGTKLITSDYMDSEGKITATLLTNGQYIITVLADNQPVRTIGPYYADSPGTKILRLFDVKLTAPYPGQVRMPVIVDRTNGTVLMIYSDGTSSTTALTLALYNGTCDPAKTVFNTVPLITASYDALTLASSSYSVNLYYNVTGSPYYNTTNNVIFCASYNITDATIQSQPYRLSKTISYSTYVTPPSTFTNPWTLTWIIMLIFTTFALGANVRTAPTISLGIALLATLAYGMQWFYTGNIPGTLPAVALGLTVLIALLFMFKRES